MRHLAIIALLLSMTAFAQDDSAVPRFAAAAVDDEPRTLDEQVQDLKKLAVDLNRDLFLLEEELLFPANTQVAVFISMDVGEFFALDSVEIKLDDNHDNQNNFRGGRLLG